MRRAMLLSLTGLASTVLLIILAPAPIMAQQYAINTVAGTGQVDSFAGTTISPGFASSVALDSAGNVYLAVSDASVVVRLDAVTGKQTVLVLRPRDYVTKLVSGPLTCKLPLDVNPVAIHATVPAPSLLAQASDVSDSAFA